MTQISQTSISVSGQEIKQHGTREFPCAAYLSTQPGMYPWHWHDEFECSLVLQGAAVCSTPQGCFLMRPGEGIFLNSSTLHRIELLPEGSCRKQDLVFHGRLVFGSTDSIFYRKYLQPFFSPEAPQFFLLRPGIPWQAEILERNKKIFRLCQTKPEGYEFTVRNLLSENFLDLCCYQNVPEAPAAPVNCFESDRVKQMLLYLQTNYSNAITLARLADHMNISQRECLRSFQKILGISPMQYLIHYRIAKSCLLLRHSRQSVLEIGSLCGFESPSYFTKTFKKHVGSTPTQYRNGLSETNNTSDSFNHAGNIGCSKS